MKRNNNVNKGELAQRTDIILPLFRIETNSGNNPAASISSVSLACFAWLKHECCWDEHFLARGCFQFGTVTVLILKPRPLPESLISG